MTWKRTSNRYVCSMFIWCPCVPEMVLWSPPPLVGTFWGPSTRNHVYPVHAKDTCFAVNSCSCSNQALSWTHLKAFPPNFSKSQCISQAWSRKEPSIHPLGHAAFEWHVKHVKHDSCRGWSFSVWHLMTTRSFLGTLDDDKIIIRDTWWRQDHS